MFWEIQELREQNKNPLGTQVESSSIVVHGQLD